MQILVFHILLVGGSLVLTLLAAKILKWRDSFRDRLSCPKRRQVYEGSASKEAAIVNSAMEFNALHLLHRGNARSICLDSWQASMFHGRSTLQSQVWKCANSHAAAFVLGALATITAPANADDSAGGWNKFQNGGQGAASSTLPTQWSADPQTIAWQTDLTGYGQSSPVVRNQKIFLTSTSGLMKEKFHVFALGLTDGKQLWKQDFDNPTPEENNSYVSRAAPSPAVDDDAVYALHEGGVLVSLDHSGKTRWQRNLVAEYGAIKARHGLASSLEQDAKHLFVWIERGEDPYLMSIDKATGATDWKVAGLGATTWGSPRLVQVDEQPQLVCSASGKLVGFNAKTGERLWELSDIVNNTSSTPIPAGNGRFFIGASDGRGEESSSNSAKAGGLVQITSQAGAFTAKFLWRAEKANCSFGSPVIAAGKVWIVNRSGALYELDLETGKQLKVTRVKSGSVWATPLSDAGRIYVFGQKGTTSVVSTEDGSELATNSLWEAAAEEQATAASAEIQYAAAVADGNLLIRSGSKLYVIR